MGQVDLPPPSKDDTSYVATPENESLNAAIERDWTAEEEKKAKRKYGVASRDQICRRLTLSIGWTS